MNTLEELNVYSSESVSVTDDRTYAVIFDTAVAVNQSISVALNQAHIVRLGNNVLEIINPPSGLTFSIDVGVSGASVSWISSAPAGVTLDTSVPGVYTLSGITKNTHWDYAKSAVITPAVDSSSAFDYVCTIGFPEYAGETSRTWITTTTITALGSYTSLSDVDFDPGYASPVTSYPTITSEGVTSRFRVTIAASELSNMTSTGGGSAVFSLGTYVITGTKTQVNARLRTLVLTSSSTSDFVMTYLVQNLETGVLTYYQQNVVKDLANAETANLGINRTYTENTVGLLFTDNYPDNIESDSGENQYTISITLSDAIGKITLESLDYPLDWDSDTRTWSITGTKTECNAALRSLYFMPKRNVSSTTNITFRQYKGTLLQTSNTVSLIGAVRTSAIPGAGIFAFKQDGSLQLTYEQAHYLNCDIIIAAGGGGGGAGELLGTTMVSGGNGGAGGTKYIQNYTGFEVLKYKNDTTSFNVAVGAGGTGATYNTQGTNGGDSKITFQYNGYNKLGLGAGDYGTMALTKDQQIVGWGYNNNGVLGTGDLDIRPNVSNLNTNPVWIQVASSDTNGARLNEDGQVWMSGENGFGSIGNGTTSGIYSTPVLIAGTYTKVVLGYAFGLGLTTTGDIRAWGLNSKGQLGLGNTTNRSTPTLMTSQTGWRDVSAGYQNALAVKNDGTLWFWGDRATLSDVLTPTQVGTDTDWDKVFDGRLATKTDGTLWECYELQAPTQKGTLSNIVKASFAGTNFHYVALDVSGNIYTWGLNTSGQLGLGDTTNRSTPTLVSGGPWTDIGVSHDNTYAIDTFGRVYTCGNASAAGLGNGTISGDSVKTLTEIATTLLHMYGGGAGAVTYYNGSAWVGINGQNSVADDGILTGSGGGGYAHITPLSNIENGGWGVAGQGSGGQDGTWSPTTADGITAYGASNGGGAAGTIVNPTFNVNSNGFVISDAELAATIYTGSANVIRVGYGGGAVNTGTVNNNTTDSYNWATGGYCKIYDNVTHELVDDYLNIPIASPLTDYYFSKDGTPGIVLIKFYE